jgi:DNA-directed RNA polymerase specialized sigma subunit
MMLLDTLEELISIGAEELRKSILSYDISGDTNFTRHFVELLRVRFQAAIGKVNEG